MNARKIKWLILSGSLCCINLQAQVSVLYFDKITTQNGLSHNKVNCIIQDKRGFIWIGTDDGLNRFDGHNFQLYRFQPQNSSGISGNIVTDLLEDENEILWIATADGGLSRFDYRLPPKLQFRQYKHVPGDSNSIPANIINSLLQDKDGYLWLATSGHSAIRFNKITGHFDVPALYGTTTALDLALDSEDSLWVGRVGGGLLKIHPRSLKFKMDERYFDLYAKLPHATVTSLYKDSRNNIWFGSWDRVLYQYETVKARENVFRPTTTPGSFVEDEILSFAEDKEGNIWMGGRYNGLQVYDRGKNQFTNYRYDAAREGSISDNRINCVFIDKQGLVWIGTNRGVSVSNPVQQQFTQIFLPSEGKQVIIYDFHKDEKGRVWIGTNEGIYLWQQNTGSLEHKPVYYKGNKLSVTKFFIDKAGNWFLGTDYSLFSFDPRKFTVQILPNTDKDMVMNKIIDSRVVSVVSDSIDGHPVLLVSPYGHYLAYYDLYEKKWVSRLDTTRKILQNFNITDNLVRKMVKTRAGKIWLATAKSGLGEWVRNSSPKITYYTNNPANPGGLSNNHVFDVSEGGSGDLWLSTYGGGLHHFNVATKEFQHIPSANNLLEGLQCDGEGNVWMISNGDLHKYNSVNNAYTSFSLPDLEKSGGVRGYIYRDSSGHMYVAGTGYFISFNPKTIRTLRNKPKVYFTNFQIFNTSYSDLVYNKSIALRHNQNYFSISFSAPDFSSGFSSGAWVRYACMLEGIDKDWVQTGTRNFFNYSNLPGGTYTFKVKATNSPGSWNSEIASLRIVIIPPFWKTWWFYASCVALAALIVYVIYRYRINELVKRQAIRNKIAQDLHDNVGSTLSSISVYSQVAKIYKQQDKQELLQDTLEKISGTSSEMISEMNDIVWAINPRNDNMATILARMESFARPLLASQEIQFHFKPDVSVANLHLEMTKRKNLYLIFKEAINNALKYSGCRNIWVTIKHHHHQIELKVRDDGAGFEPSEAISASTLSGNGLRNMQMRAKETKGSLSIDSGSNKGTEIMLIFPLP